MSDRQEKLRELKGRAININSLSAARLLLVDLIELLEELIDDSED